MPLIPSQRLDALSVPIIAILENRELCYNLQVEAFYGCAESGQLCLHKAVRVDIVRSLFGILPDDVTLEEAKEEGLNLL